MTTSNVSTESKQVTKRSPRKPTTTSKRPRATATTKPKIIEENISLELPSNPFVFEILQLTDRVQTDEKKIEVLKKYEHNCLKTIFIWNYDDNVLSMLPPGDVPYSTVGEDLVKTGTVSENIQKEVEKMEFYNNPSVGYAEKIRTGHTSLRTEYEKLINFVKSKAGVPGNNNLSPLRRESMFIEMVQGLHPLDAEIVCLVKDKKLQTKYNITKDLVKIAYPDITWEVNR
jgi:hypothetical protein